MGFTLRNNINVPSILFIAFLIFGLFRSGEYVVTGNINQTIGLMILSILSLMILYEPKNGLLILPIVSYVVPSGLINIAGIPLLSPGLIISSVTFFSIGFHIAVGKIRLKLPFIFSVFFPSLRLKTVEYIPSPE